MTSLTHLPAMVSAPATRSVAHRLPAPSELLRRVARALGSLYADRPRTPAQSFWHDGDLPSVPYSSLTSLSRYR